MADHTYCCGFAYTVPHGQVCGHASCGKQGVESDIIHDLRDAITVMLPQANHLPAVIEPQHNTSAISIGKGGHRGGEVIRGHGPLLKFGVQILALGQKFAECIHGLPLCSYPFRFPATWRSTERHEMPWRVISIDLVCLLLFIQPRCIPAHDVIDPKVIGGRHMTFHVGVVRVVHLLPGHREHGRILFHDVLSLANERFALGSV